MSAHTPGPWTADEVRHDWDQVIRNANRDPVALAQFAGYGPKTGKANARLIAVAPELLAALKKLHGYWINGDGAEEAEAAIKKAEGRT